MKMEKGDSMKEFIHNIKNTSMMLNNIRDEVTDKMRVDIVFHALLARYKNVR
jgi:hypothetical protein